MLNRNSNNGYSYGTRENLNIKIPTARYQDFLNLDFALISKASNVAFPVELSIISTKSFTM